MGLAKQAQHFLRAFFGEDAVGQGVVEVSSGDQVEDDRHEAGLLNGFATRRRIVDSDGNPEALSGGETRAWRMEAFIKGIDVLAEQSSHRRSEDAWEFGLQQMTQGATEAFASGGIVGMAARGGALVHT